MDDFHVDAEAGGVLDEVLTVAAVHLHCASITLAAQTFLTVRRLDPKAGRSTTGLVTPVISLARSSGPGARLVSVLLAQAPR
ncbi:hypothetical protein [Streptomyces cyanogenus]|uniref:hypothetical protein n=1 Tax=Streptomyces cyanogenus TaxID=80860 RepID=UPI001AA1C089|nr:hypothetical protein [Streptomyces cyanogenus]